MPDPSGAEPTSGPDAAAALVAALTARHLTIAVAESLTGGLLVAELVRIPGASVVVAGGVVAYQTPLKHTLLGVDALLLAEHGAVHPEVARQMATGVRTALAIDGRPADIGISTTGVAGPDEQDGQSVGTVYLGVSFGDRVRAIAISLTGDRAAIRMQTVAHAIEAVCQLIESTKLQIAE
ncbi:CinA family protein [Cryobacterium sp. TMT4-31]|uniref:CinA family protein n=1 Tax=Cryobacterium sp. TMT4-31 TaxID=1259259 RepID=UPI00106B1644|nr:CinA family protein [Cryobacterium sp. TMT4-31]TFC87898.1 CinA family protein [Cryobacterium sp. TMT4-31]